MNGNGEFRPRIAPVPEGTPRPLWSVMIPTYNCAAYLREALGSVLAQDPGPEVMQIEVVDDGSTRDDPEAVAAELGRGRVAFFRQPQNLGHVGNFNSCIARSRGRLVHLLHGDDCVRGGFYDRLAQGLALHAEAGAAFCRGIYMDDDGNWLSFSPLEASASGILDGWLERIASGQRVATPSIAVRRSVYERLGGFDRRFSVSGEDWEMWVRIAVAYPVFFEREPLALYRMRRPGSLTRAAEMEPLVVADMRRASEIIGSYLPDSLPAAAAARALRQARSTWAGWALRNAYYLREDSSPAVVGRHLREALRCSPRPGIAVAAARLFASALAHWVRRVAAGGTRSGAQGAAGG